MSHGKWILIAVLFGAAVIIVSCNINPQPAGLTPIPSLVPAATVTLRPYVQTEPVSGTPGGQTGQPQQVSGAVGAGIFIDKCSPCHGNQGEGVDAPPLRNNSFIQSGDQQVIQTISDGRPGTAMPGWLMSNGGPLTAGEIDDIVSYLHSLQNAPAVPPATEAPTETSEAPVAAPTTGPTPEPAMPSGGGNPGPAANLTGDATKGMPDFGQYCARCHGPQGVLGIPNPGSEDQFVPQLNPIDPTIVNSDPKVFAANVDRFIEHGSVPEGTNPWLAMPAFGDRKLLNDQTIADLIAYVIKLNTQK